MRGFKATYTATVAGTLMLAAVFSLGACASGQVGGSAPASNAAAVEAESPTADDVAEYGQVMTDLAAQEAKLLKRYGAVTGDNYKNDATTYKALVKLLPDVQSFISDLEAVTPPAGAIAAAHETLIEGWNAQSEGMILVASALEAQDLELVARGNEKLADGRALLRKAEEEMAAAVKGYQ